LWQGQEQLELGVELELGLALGLELKLELGRLKVYDSGEVGSVECW